MNVNDLITTRMIAAERNMPIPTVAWIMNGKGAPDPVIQHASIKFYNAKAVARFFKTYKPKRVRGRNKKRKAA
jgi:hypothetical protein